MSKNKKINKGILISGGEINSQNIAIGKNSKIVNDKKIHESNDNSFEEYEINNLKTVLKNEVADNKIEEVIIKLIDHFKSKQNNQALNTIVLLSSSLNQVKLQNNLSLITHENTKQSIAKITFSILELIDKEIK